MRRQSSFLFVILTFLVTMVFLFSCTTDGETLNNLGAADIEKIDTSMGQAFSGTNLHDPSNGRVVTEDGNDISVTWTEYSTSGMVINGTLNITVTPSGLYSGTADLDGTLTFTGTGAVVDELVFDIAVDYNITPLQPANSTFEVSGTVDIDGTSFDAEGLTNEDLIFDIMLAFLI